jgi:hypothetical protein
LPVNLGVRLLECSHRKQDGQMKEETKGLIFLLLMIPIGIRYFIKTGNNDLSLNKVDYAIAVAIVAVIVIINI